MNFVYVQSTYKKHPESALINKSLIQSINCAVLDDDENIGLVLGVRVNLANNDFWVFKMNHPDEATNIILTMTDLSFEEVDHMVKNAVRVNK